MKPSAQQGSNSNQDMEEHEEYAGNGDLKGALKKLLKKFNKPEEKNFIYDKLKEFRDKPHENFAGFVKSVATALYVRRRKEAGKQAAQSAIDEFGHF